MAGGEPTGIDLADVLEGAQITVTWRGKAVFLRHRMAADIALARATPLSDRVDTDT